MIRYVYVAGPLTARSGKTQAQHVDDAIDAGTKLLQLGFHPYIPHLSHFWDQRTPRPYEVWMALDFAWIVRCDALLRMPGESPGADREVFKARDLGVPVFYSIEELVAARIA